MISEAEDSIDGDTTMNSRPQRLQRILDAMIILIHIAAFSIILFFNQQHLNQKIYHALTAYFQKVSHLPVPPGTLRWSQLESARSCIYLHDRRKALLYDRVCSAKKCLVWGWLGFKNCWFSSEIKICLRVQGFTFFEIRVKSDESFPSLPKGLITPKFSFAIFLSRPHTNNLPTICPLSILLRRIVHSQYSLLWIS